MSDQCNEPLGNFGQSCKLALSEIKRIIFVSKLDADGNANKILKTDAILKASLQALIDVPNFATDPLTKLVVTPLLYGVASEQGDAVTYDENGYYKKLADGDYTINFMLNELIAKQVGAIKGIETNDVAVYLIDAKSRIVGVDGRELGDATYLYPIDVQNINVPDFTLPSRGGISQEAASLRLDTPNDMNSVITLQIADANVNSDADFYSLIDVDTVISAPAITGCTAVLSEAWDGSALTGLVFGDFVFYDDAAPAVAIPATSATETPDGTYDVAATLGAGTTNKLKITKDKYDIEVGVVVVP